MGRLSFQIMTNDMTELLWNKNRHKDKSFDKLNHQAAKLCNDVFYSEQK